MTAAFPIASKLAMLSSIGDQFQDGSIRSTVDVGPALVRSRYTAVVRNLDVPCVFTPAERATFDAWWTTTIANGSLSFTWTDPVSGSTVTMRFRDTKGPQWTGNNGGTSQTWSATLALEILP